MIGMIVPTTNFIFADIVRGARETVEAQGGRLVLGMSGYLDTEDPVQAEHLLAGGAEGLLIAPSWFGGVPADGQEKWLLECPVPAVLVERTAPASTIPPQGSTACARTGRTAPRWRWVTSRSWGTGRSRRYCRKDRTPRRSPRDIWPRWSRSG